MLLSRRARVQPLVVVLIALALVGAVLAETAFATPTVAATVNKTTARCFAFAQSAGVTSRRAALGERLCGGLDNLSQLMVTRLPGANQPKTLPRTAPAYPLKVSPN